MIAWSAYVSGASSPDFRTCGLVLAFLACSSRQMGGIGGYPPYHCQRRRHGASAPLEGANPHGASCAVDALPLPHGYIHSPFTACCSWLSHGTFNRWAALVAFPRVSALTFCPIPKRKVTFMVTWSAGYAGSSAQHSEYFASGTAPHEDAANFAALSYVGALCSDVPEDTPYRVVIGAEEPYTVMVEEARNTVIMSVAHVLDLLDIFSAFTV